MKIGFRNKKGMELSINMLVIVAMAIFTLFLIVGFVLGGFSYFKGIFGGVSSTPDQVAQTKCEISLNSYLNRYERGATNVPQNIRDQLCADRVDVDFDGDGISGGTVDDPKDLDDRTYDCQNYVDTQGIC
ncbi:TPA: hypothetical protein H1012_00065 [archaeon]|nr:hypothetical protein [Candidatus Naiadarchaeales archaeon SRR2090159.bin1288]